MSEYNNEKLTHIARETKDFITLLYNFTFLPIYYYDDNGLSFCMPTEAIDYPPPQKYLDAFLSFSHVCSYQMTEFHAFYGYTKDILHGGYYILGPCTTVPYDTSAYFTMHREFHVSKMNSEHFLDFMKSIPRKNDNDFISQLSFLAYCANMQHYTPHDLMFENPEESDKEIAQHYITAHLNDKEDLRENNTLEVESKIISVIETGDLNKLNQLFQSPSHVDAGTIANTSLRNTKNIIIISIALYCRAAIRGGVSPDVAFHLSDSYIQRIELSNSTEAIYAISGKALYDYTERVTKTRSNLHGDPVIQKAIRYIQHNTHQHISVSDVAEYIGLSRGYLSASFKEKLGFDISSFIRRCKLEESKELLRFSDRSISEISNYLCFSSQSHFQNAFKKQYKITPQQYRHGVEP